MVAVLIESEETAFLADYCRRCVDDCGCSRWTTLTGPDQIEAAVSGGVLLMEAVYLCAAGHQWTTRFIEPVPVHAELKG